MSERGLVVHHAALADIEGALQDASDRIAAFIADLGTAVEEQTAGWTEETPSRQAQRSYETRLTAGVEELAGCLVTVKEAVAAYRESAHDVEVENVAVVG